MSEQATAPRPAPRAQQGKQPFPGKGKKAHEYLLEANWFPLGDPENEHCLWYEPGFRVMEEYGRVSEPMTNEVARHEAGKQALIDGKISHNPEPRLRNQVVVKPASLAVPTAVAYRSQLYMDLRERELQLRAERAAAG